ncbi:MAG: hypothetical protein WCQ95_02055 [Bacteroidota bacterium]
MKKYKINEVDIGIFLEDNQQLLPESIQKMVHNYHTTLQIIIGIADDAYGQLSDKLDDLFFKQYPSILVNSNNQLPIEVLMVAEDAAWFMPIRTYKLIMDQKAGLDVCKLYPQFNKWATELNSAQKPIDEKGKSKSALLQIKYDAKRKKEFMQLVEKMLLYQFPAIANFNTNEQIVYKALLNQQYAQYKADAERMQLLYDCGFSNDDIKLSKTAILKKMKQLSPQKQAEIKALEARRRQGEKI